MSQQVSFILVTILALGAFSFSVFRLAQFFKLTKGVFRIGQIPNRLILTLKVGLGQTKILRKPVVGLIHALVFWGFLVITVGTIEIILDGFFERERILASTGVFYKFITGSGDVLALIVILSCLIFLFRRLALRVKRFEGEEMTSKSSLDATVALTLILLLMVSLLGLNTGYVILNPTNHSGWFPVSQALAQMLPLSPQAAHTLQDTSWWVHIILVFLFANLLPYSKHFHVFMSIPNVFLSRLGSYTQLDNMASVTREVKLMLDPGADLGSQDAPPEISRFGVKDVEDVSWKNYLDSLTCTECGRCTSVCPANLTGKKLSPRKIFVDLRKRMNDKGPGLAKNSDYDDGRSLVGDYITAEELWACTTCNACVQECPVNIDHVSLIVDMRRYLVMEESSAPNQINIMFSNIENNGAPWPFPQTERMKWAEELTMTN